MTSRVERADKRANKLRVVAESTISAIRDLQVIFAKNRAKFESIGLNTSLLGEILEDAARLERVVREKWS